MAATVLPHIIEGYELSDKPARYVLDTDCGYLLEADPVTGQRYCGIFGESDRPGICDEFQENGYFCWDGRVRKGVSTEPERQSYLNATQS